MSTPRGQDTQNTHLLKSSLYIMESPIPAMMVQEQQTTEAIGRKVGNVGMLLQVPQKDRVRKQNRQDTDPQAFPGTGYKLKEKGSPPKYARNSPSTSEMERSEWKLNFFEKSDEISQFVYAMLDAYNNGEIKQSFKEYSREEVMKFLEECEEDETGDGESEEYKTLTQRTLEEGGGVGGESSNLPHTIYEWCEDAIKTIPERR